MKTHFITFCVIVFSLLENPIHTHKIHTVFLFKVMQVRQYWTFYKRSNISFQSVYVFLIFK